MPETTVSTSIKTRDTTKVSTSTEEAITTTQTDNCSKTSNETVTNTPDARGTMRVRCPCSKFDLDKIAEESRRCAFKSSNIILATSNAIVVFTLLVLQEILITQCRRGRLNYDTLFLITSAIAALGDSIKINNPPPFTS